VIIYFPYKTAASWHDITVIAPVAMSDYRQDIMYNV